MDYDLIVVKTLERVYKNYYYIIRGEKDMKPNFRKFKKIVYHKTMPHGGWKKYKDAMKKAGFR